MSRYLSYPIIALNAMLLLLAFFQERLSVPFVMQVTGRLHPALLHLPIGFLVLGLILFVVRRRFHQPTIFQLLDGTWHLTALAAVTSALAGIALSKEEGYGGTILYRHMNMGVAFSVLSALLAALWHRGKGDTAGFSILLAATGIGLILTGHNGATLTHGEDFLTQPFKAPQQPEVVSDSTTVFDAGLLPLFDRKCNSCHNPGKKKGGLVMTTAALVEQGGENGALWEPGNPKASLLYQHIMLPMEHDDHMPPSGKPQLSDIEKELIRMFIARGADLKQGVSELPAQDSLLTLLKKIQPDKTSKTKTEGRSFEPVNPDKLKKLNSPSRSITPLSLGDPGLSVAFFLPGQFTNSLVNDLRSVRENIVDVNLSGMPVTKDVLDILASFTNLETINLNQTPVTDEWLGSLTKLIHLREISLAGTKTTLAGFTSLGALKELRTVYTWQAGLQPGDIDKLASLFPHINWDAGAENDSKEVLRLTPPLLGNENRILGPAETIRLRHNLPGVQIRYTTSADGPDPDSVSGEIFTKPLAVKGSVRIRARAVKAGWRSSRLAEYSFFTAGLKPDTALLNSPPNKDYRAAGAKSLIDARAGDAENFRDGAWLGYRENPLVATLGFQAPRELTTISLSYLKNIGSYIMPPAEVKVMAGNSTSEMKTIAVVKPRQPGGYDPNQVEAIVVPVKGKFSLWKISVTPVAKLPAWHGGKGSPGWVMVDEIYLYP